MELGDAVRSAVTSRYFTDQPVTDEELRTAFDYARFAPQGGNRQPARWVVVRDQAMKDQLQEWYLVPWKGYLAAAQSGDINIGKDEAAKMAKTLGNADHFAEHMSQAPAIVVACAEIDGLHPTDTELDRLSIVGGGSIYPAVQNFVLGCREANLGAALTTLLVMYEPQVKEMLNIPDGVITAAHIVVGHRPKPFPTKLDRLPLEGLVYTDQFGNETYS